MRRSLFVLLALPVSLALRLTAQSPTERAAIEALRDSLARVTDSLSLKRLEAAMIQVAKQHRDDPLVHVRLAFVAHRLGETANTKSQYDAAAGEFEWAAELRPDWRYPWYGLGLAELAQGEHAVIAIENRRQRWRGPRKPTRASRRPASTSPTRRWPSASSHGSRWRCRRCGSRRRHPRGETRRSSWRGAGWSGRSAKRTRRWRRSRPTSASVATPGWACSSLRGATTTRNDRPTGGGPISPGRAWRGRRRRWRCIAPTWAWWRTLTSWRRSTASLPPGRGRRGSSGFGCSATWPKRVSRASG